MFQNRRTFCSSLLALAGLGRPGSSAAAGEKEIERAIKGALAAWKTPGAAVAIVREDRVDYLQGHGLREQGTRKPVTPDTLFPLGSCSKGFISASLALLADEGKLGWDDPVRKHVDSFRLSDPLADREVACAICSVTERGWGRTICSGIAPPGPPRRPFAGPA